MIYGDKKILELTRGLLPSSGYKNARFQKKALNRRLRRKVNQSLLEQSYLCEDEDLKFDLKSDWQHKRSEIINARRNGDNLGAIIRWSKHKAKNIPDKEKLSYIKGMIKSNGIIIDHALSHVKEINGFNNDTHAYSSYFYFKKKPKIPVNYIASILKLILEDGTSQKLFSNIIKDNIRPVEWYKHRYVSRFDKEKNEMVDVEEFYVTYKEPQLYLLLGSHNIDSFIKYYKEKQELFVAGDGVHYALNYNGTYTSKKLLNPKHQPYLLTTIKKALEGYVKTGRLTAPGVSDAKKIWRSNPSLFRLKYLKYDWAW